MRLRTIWTIHNMPILERLRRTNEWLALSTARRLPGRVRYWATMTEIAKATRTSPHIPATPLDEVLKNLDPK